MGLTVKQACAKLKIKSGRVLYMLRVTHQIKGKVKDGAWDIDPQTVTKYRQEQMARHSGKAKAAPKKKAAARKPRARQMLLEEPSDGMEE